MDNTKLSFLREILKWMKFVEVVEPKKKTAKEKKIFSGIEKAIDHV